MKKMESDPWEYEKKAVNDGFSFIAGVDEAGRGPLAGPVVSAAVIFPYECDIVGIRDSKTLTPRKRDSLYGLIYEQALSIGVGIVDTEEIDRVNILQASLHSMAIAVDNLSCRPEFLLIDGKFEIDSNVPQKTIVKGDAKSVSVGAASIIAKVTRDRLMERYHQMYPLFGFAQHKGYPTRLHREAIRRFGPCPIHRRSFRGVKEYVREP